MICPEVVEPTTTRARASSGERVRVSAARLLRAPSGGIEGRGFWPLPFGSLQIAGAPCRTTGWRSSGVRNGKRDTSHCPSLPRLRARVERVSLREDELGNLHERQLDSSLRPRAGRAGRVAKGTDLRVRVEARSRADLRGNMWGIRWVVTLERHNAMRAPALPGPQPSSESVECADG